MHDDIPQIPQVAQIPIFFSEKIAGINLPWDMCNPDFPLVPGFQDSQFPDVEMTQLLLRQTASLRPLDSPLNIIVLWGWR